MRLGKWTMGAVALLAALAPGLGVAAGNEVNVYSYRQPFLVQPLFDAFTKATGITVNVVHAEKGLVERLKAEGANSPADLVLTVDIGRLDEVVAAGVAQSVSTPTLLANVPVEFRHPDGLWYGMTSRVRLIYASKERVKPGEIKTYEDLADPKWKGRICTRSGKHDYNVALIASMIAQHGVEGAEAWLKGVKANLAQKPQGNERGQVKAIKEGVCDLAIGNNYYYGAMLKEPDQKAWAESVNLVFPNQDDRGTHVNLSGVVLTKASPNKTNAIRLMEFLSGPGQKLYAEQNWEYPVKPGEPWLPEVEAWGHFKKDSRSLAQIAELRGAAVKMVDRVGFDN